MNNIGVILMKGLIIINLVHVCATFEVQTDLLQIKFFFVSPNNRKQIIKLEIENT